MLSKTQKMKDLDSKLKVLQPMLKNKKAKTHHHGMRATKSAETGNNAKMRMKDFINRGKENRHRKQKIEIFEDKGVFLEKLPASPSLLNNDLKYPNSKYINI